MVEQLATSELAAGSTDMLDGAIVEAFNTFKRANPQLSLPMMHVVLLTHVFGVVVETFRAAFDIDEDEALRGLQELLNDALSSVAYTCAVH